jgi:hypothetical protein
MEATNPGYSVNDVAANYCSRRTVAEIERVTLEELAVDMCEVCGWLAQRKTLKNGICPHCVEKLETS